MNSWCFVLMHFQLQCGRLDPAFLTLWYTNESANLCLQVRRHHGNCEELASASCLTVLINTVPGCIWLYQQSTHITGPVSVCWAIWKLRNKVCFEKEALEILGRSTEACGLRCRREQLCCRSCSEFPPTIGPSRMHYGDPWMIFNIKQQLNGFCLENRVSRGG